MKKSINITPFSDYWINCEINDYLTILTSLDKSYRIVPLVNDYMYLMAGNVGWITCIDMKYSESFNKKVNILNKIDYSFTNEQSYMEEIKDCIDKGKFLSIRVDLFNWIPESLLYQKYHMSHFSLFTGYDDEKSVFYVFDDDAYGYKEHEIPYERFQLSVMKDDGIQARQILMPDSIKSYPFHFSEVLIFAQRIKNDILYLSYVGHFFNFSDEILVHFIAILSKITNRQKANKLLFLYLYEEGYIKKELSLQLAEYAEKLQNDWQTVKSLFIRCLFHNNKPDYEKINHISWDNLQLEYKMWDCLTKSV